MPSSLAHDEKNAYGTFRHDHARVESIVRSRFLPYRARATCRHRPSRACVLANSQRRDDTESHRKTGPNRASRKDDSRREYREGRIETWYQQPVPKLFGLPLAIGQLPPNRPQDRDLSVKSTQRHNRASGKMHFYLLAYCSAMSCCDFWPAEPNKAACLNRS